MKYLKQQILSLLLNIYAAKERLTRTTKNDPQQGMSILILPPADFGSLGDEAMVTGIIEYLSDKGAKQVGLISCGLCRYWDNFKPEIGNIEICHYSLTNSWKNWFEFTGLVSSYDQFYCLGADVMDGKYSESSSLTRLKYVSLAIKTGGKAAILGFSFNEQPIAIVIEAFQKLPLDVRLYARDPVSQERLINRLRRPVKLVADLAFLLRPASSPGSLSDVLQWIKKQKCNGRIVVGINANSQIISNPDEEVVNKFIQIHVDTLTEIYSKNDQTSFMLIPHDFRKADNKSSDIGLSEAILKALPSEIKSHCLRLPTPFSAGEIKSLAGNLDIALSSRMHFAIACLGQGTPVACITYQGKFEGLFRHFELEGMLIKPEDALQDGGLGKFIIPIIERRDNIRRHIQQKLPKIQQLAQANFNEEFHTEKYSLRATNNSLTQLPKVNT